MHSHPGREHKSVGALPVTQTMTAKSEATNLGPDSHHHCPRKRLDFIDLFPPYNDFRTTFFSLSLFTSLLFPSSLFLPFRRGVTFYASSQISTEIPPRLSESHIKLVQGMRRDPSTLHGDPTTLGPSVIKKKVRNVWRSLLSVKMHYFLSLRKRLKRKL